MSRSRIEHYNSQPSPFSHDRGRLALSIPFSNWTDPQLEVKNEPDSTDQPPESDRSSLLLGILFGRVHSSELMLSIESRVQLRNERCTSSTGYFLSEAILPSQHYYLTIFARRSIHERGKISPGISRSALAASRHSRLCSLAKPANLASFGASASHRHASVSASRSAPKVRRI